MKKQLIVIALIMVGFAANGQLKDATVWSYINTYKDIALEQERLYGVPATITLAQGIVESGAGTSKLTKKSNNHFGIKAHKKWKGPVSYAKDDDPGLSPFRKYNSPRESYEDHSRFLAVECRGLYGELFSYSKYDYRNWAHGLKRKGYASASNYALLLIQYIEKFQLYKLNGGFKYQPSTRQSARHGKQKRTIDIPVFIPDVEIVDDDEMTEEEETYDKVMSLPHVAMINGVHCKRLYPGETLSSIAIDNELTKYDLLEYNEVPNEDGFQEGDIVYLAKKKNKYNDTQDHYTICEGDTWHSISQKFGINMSYLLKKNKKKSTDLPVVGERLRLK